MNQVEEPPLIVCLNYCRIDPDNGHCLTCGRPPVPVSGVDLAAPLLGGLKLAGLSLPTLKGSAERTDVPDES